MAAPAVDDEDGAVKPRSFSTKVYVVTAPNEDGNLEVVDVKLSWASADKAAEARKGATVKKWVATK
ncbi:hypothetical protein H10PHJ05_35 [Aeromonas phage HJ05]|nr:hypothetical protein H10PHJ05_35 [Aeromonas phage HJ05]